jgi:hypothetical protein
MSFSIRSVYKQIHPLFRRHRMAQFVATFQPDASDRILDVGGYADFWAGSGLASDITLLNIHPVPDDGLPPNMHTVLGDGTALTYEDKSFSIVFSNSVIEHLGSFENQQRFAKECIRVGAWLMGSDALQELSNRTALLVAIYSFLPKRVPTADAAKLHRLGMVDQTFRHTNTGCPCGNSPTNLSGDETSFSRLRN